MQGKRKKIKTEYATLRKCYSAGLFEPEACDAELINRAAKMHIVRLKISGFRGGRPELVWADGMKRGEVRRAMRLVNEMRDAFLARWREIHG